MPAIRGQTTPAKLFVLNNESQEYLKNSSRYMYIISWYGRNDTIFTSIIIIVGMDPSLCILKMKGSITRGNYYLSK